MCHSTKDTGHMDQPERNDDPSRWKSTNKIHGKTNTGTNILKILPMSQFGVDISEKQIEKLINAKFDSPRDYHEL